MSNLTLSNQEMAFPFDPLTPYGTSPDHTPSLFAEERCAEINYDLAETAHATNDQPTALERERAGFVQVANYKRKSVSLSTVDEWRYR